MNKFIVLIIISVLTLTSCFKEDERITPYDRGDKTTATIEMTQTYKYQVYYDLEQAQAVTTVSKLDFDLMFDSKSDGSRIFLNTANFMLAAPTGKFDLDEVTSAAGLPLTFDPSTGNRDSTAIGNWFQDAGSDSIFFHEVYVIDRGYDDLGNLLGFKKIVFDSLIGSSYYFRYANLNGTGLVSGKVTKTPQKNFAYFSFNNSGMEVTPEPPKLGYDLLFTQYTTLLYTNEGDPYPYLVTGVLLNRTNTLCAMDNSLVFDSITREQVVDFNYTDQLDAVGYDWKDVVGDVSSGVVYYEVKPENNYIIKNRNGFFFKMRFIGFYNQSGEKGYPTIEFQKL